LRLELAARGMRGPWAALEFAAQGALDLAPFSAVLGCQKGDRLAATAHAPGTADAMGEPLG